MDTLEFNYEQGGFAVTPVVWRGKSPQDLCRERYSECILDKAATAPKSLSNTTQSCDHYFVREKHEVKNGGMIKASLVPIPEKP